MAWVAFMSLRIMIKSIQTVSNTVSLIKHSIVNTISTAGKITGCTIGTTRLAIKFSHSIISQIRKVY